METLFAAEIESQTSPSLIVYLRTQGPALATTERLSSNSKSRQDQLRTQSKDRGNDEGSSEHTDELSKEGKGTKECVERGSFCREWRKSAGSGKEIVLGSPPFIM